MEMLQNSLQNIGYVFFNREFGLEVENKISSLKLQNVF